MSEMTLRPSRRMRPPSETRRILFVCEPQEVRRKISDLFMELQAANRGSLYRYELYFTEPYRRGESARLRSMQLPQMLYDYAVGLGSDEDLPFDAEHRECWNISGQGTGATANVESAVRQFFTRLTA